MTNKLPADVAAVNPDDAFPEDLQGLPGLHLAGDDAGRAFIARQGAQVLSWKGVDGQERLYLSPTSGGMTRADDNGTRAQPIRGGIPVCFPQFSDRGPMVKHGFARVAPWRLAADSVSPTGKKDKGSATLFLNSDCQTGKIWPHAFYAEAGVELGKDNLTVSLCLTNTGPAPWEFTAALHTYLRVGDIRNTRLSGLRNARYQDATAHNAESVQQEEELSIGDEVDRVYLSPCKQLLLLENGKPSLRIEQQGFADTVVWNPGPARARALRDFPDDDWLRMLCVEAACVVTPIRLQPGETWSGSQTLTIL